MSLGPHQPGTAPPYYNGAPVPPRGNNTSVILGAIGSAISLVIGPMAVYLLAEDRSSWFWTITIGAAVHGLAGLVLGIAALRSNRKQSPYPVATPGKVLGIVSVSGGAIGLTISLFFITIMGFAVSLFNFS